MRHSITFTDTAASVSKNTWTDWGIIPTQVPLFQTPPVKTNFMELAGGNGRIDLTTAITGYPVYDDRTGSISFLSPDRWTNWLSTFNAIKRFLHGQYVKVTLEDEPGWYYEGRISVNEMYCDEQHGTFTLDYELGPFAWAESATDEPWLWDPFSFETGVIYDGVYVDISVLPPKTWQGADTAQHISVTTTAADLEFSAQESGDAPQQPSFLATGADVTLTITVGTTATTKTLTNGTAAKVAGLVLYRGVWLYNGRTASVSMATASGTATLGLTFRPGRL